jgi:hypothetical protein
VIPITLYSRNDVQWENVGPAHSGCGVTHLRPRNSDGTPVKLWALTCEQCEDHLRTSDRWASTISEIPETPDEIKVREDYEKRGAHDRDYIQAMALAKIAGVEIPDALQRVVTGDPAHIPAITGTMVCQNGHDCAPGSKFCSDCGSPMRKPPGLSCPEGHPVGAGAKFCAECGSSVAAAIEAPAGEPENGARKKPLKDWRLTDLKARARELGLDDTGTRPEVLARVRAAA